MPNTTKRNASKPRGKFAIVAAQFNSEIVDKLLAVLRFDGSTTLAAIVNGIAHAIGHRFRSLPVTSDPEPNHDGLDLEVVREVFESSSDFTVGIEEEFAILDPAVLDRFPHVTDDGGLLGVRVR
jgi:hypothetical protein